jgi:hypothetical protein
VNNVVVAELEFSTVVAMESCIFWDIMPFSLVKADVLEELCFYLQGGGVRQARNQHVSACCLFYAGFLHGLLFDPEWRQSVPPKR